MLRGSARNDGCIHGFALDFSRILTSIMPESFTMGMHIPDCRACGFLDSGECGICRRLEEGRGNRTAELQRETEIWGSDAGRRVQQIHPCRNRRRSPAPPAPPKLRFWTIFGGRMKKL